MRRKCQVRRPELLCARAVRERVAPATAVPLLEAARVTSDERLFAQCRRCVAWHSGTVCRSGGAEEPRDLGVAKGLLRDAWSWVARLEAAAEGR